MGRSRISKKPRKPDTPAKQGNDSIEQQVEATSHRILSGVYIASAVVSVLLLVFFFTSDMRTKIIAAKTAPVYAAQASSEDTEEPDVKSAMDDLNASREVLVASMLRMSDAEFQAFISKTTSKHGAAEAGTADMPQSEELQAMIRGGAGKSAIITYLQGLDETVLQELIGTPETASEPNADRSPRETLADAYAEAERLYPAEIDASTRLRLIDELNTTGYMYYVAEEGDTLIKLSRAFDVPLGQLVELNGIHDADVIPAGMILLFPEDTAAAKQK